MEKTHNLVVGDDAQEASDGSYSPSSSWPKVKIQLARNVASARMASGMRQQDLATESGVSKATIAAIEAARAEPKLQTIVKLADAMGTTHTILLMGENDILAINQLRTLPKDKFPEVTLTDMELFDIRSKLDSGLTTGRYDAAKEGAKAASAMGAGIGGMIGAAVGTTLMPGVGTMIGAALGSMLGLSTKKLFRSLETLTETTSDKEEMETE